MTKKATNQVQEGINTAIEISQKTANTMLKGAVQTVELGEHYVQGIYKTTYDTNMDAMKIARTYWDAMTELRKDWLQLFSKTGEKAIAAVGDFELPFQKQATEFVSSFVDNAQKTFDNLTAPAKTAAK